MLSSSFRIFHHYHHHVAVMLMGLLISPIIGFQRLSCASAEQITLYVPFSWGGLRGNITFTQDWPDDLPSSGSAAATAAAASGAAPSNTEASPTTISVYLTQSAWTSEPGGHADLELGWGLHPYPVLADIKPPDQACAANELGKLGVIDLGKKHGTLRVSRIPGDPLMVTFQDSELSLKGAKTIWGRSLSLKEGSRRICSNVITSGEVRSAVATFTRTVGGEVILRQNERGETQIFSNLFNTASDFKSVSQHDWKILATDILDTRGPQGYGRHGSCAYLQLLYDPSNTMDHHCGRDRHTHCKVGDLTRKHGPVVVGQNNNGQSRQSRLDLNLPLSELAGPRKLFLVLYEKQDARRVLTCAEIRPVVPREVKANFDMDGVTGEITFSQRHKLDPTTVKVDLKRLARRGRTYHIHQFPVPQRVTTKDDICGPTAVGGHFNPFGIDAKIGPKPSEGTNDQYEVGDLSGKHGLLPTEADNHFNVYVDFNLPLFGPNSIVGRSIVIHKPGGDRWVCASIGYPAEADLITAEARFVVPVVGRAVFRQDRNDPWSETTVLIDLSYADDSGNNTENHAWHIHLNPPGKDHFNYTGRCLSAGAHFNPYGVDLQGRSYSQCSPANPLRCEAGDLTGKSERIRIAAERNNGFAAKHLHTDVLLPLSGPDSILGRSVVVHDDFAPPIRGNRMACAAIREVHPLKGTVTQFRSDSITKVGGRVIFSQPSEWDTTKIKFELVGLAVQASGYHIHEAWVPQDKAFPCLSDVVYNHFNPFEIEAGISYPNGSADQYEVGDLAGKYGTLDGLTTYRREVEDRNLPLYGFNSILGRSMVIHKTYRERNSRWVCGSVVPEIARDEGRKIIALASFDDPRSSIQGYVRFTQLEYKDGSLSDTWIETELRHSEFVDPDSGSYGSGNGGSGRVTYEHDWAVFVNQVGDDAFIDSDAFRCVAAGHRWNPFYLIEGSDPYRRDCNAGNPLRCAIGDLSGKLSRLTVGRGKRAYTDTHLPLTGPYAIIGRSLIVYKPEGSATRAACTNIRLDNHLQRMIAVEDLTSGRFSLDAFMAHSRRALNTTDWLMVGDAQSLKYHEQGCVEFIVHFYGQTAFKLHSELDNLLSAGTVNRETKYGVEKISTPYKQCQNIAIETDEPNTRGLTANSAAKQMTSSNVISLMTGFLLYASIFLL